MPAFHENGKELFKGCVLAKDETSILAYVKGKFLVLDIKYKYNDRPKLVGAEVDAPRNLYLMAYREIAKQTLESNLAEHNVTVLVNINLPNKGKKVRTNYIRGPWVGFEGTVIKTIRGKSHQSARLVESCDGKKKIEIEANRLEVIEQSFVPLEFDLDTFNVICDALESIGLLFLGLIVQAYRRKTNLKGSFWGTTASYSLLDSAECPRR